MEKRPRATRLLPSEPEYLLEYMDTLPSDSDDEFTGYLSDDAENDDSDSEEQHGSQPTIATDSFQRKFIL